MFQKYRTRGSWHRVMPADELHHLFSDDVTSLMKYLRSEDTDFWGLNEKILSFSLGLSVKIPASRQSGVSSAQFLHPVIPNTFSMRECSVVTCAECHRPATHYAPNVQVGPWHSRNWLFNSAWLEWLVCNLLFVRCAVRHAIFDSYYATDALFCRFCAKQIQQSFPVGAVRALLVIFKTFVEFI